MSKRCSVGFQLHLRYESEIKNATGLSPAELAAMRMYQERTKRAWMDHKSRCRICSGVKSD